MFAVLFAVGLLTIIAIDYVFVHKTNPRVWKFIAISFGVAAAIALYPEPLIEIGQALKVGRPVDIVVYLCCAILFRELFLSRARDYARNEQFTGLVRELAIRNSQSLPNSLSEI